MPTFFSFLEIQKIRMFKIHVILNLIKMDGRCLMFIEWEKKNYCGIHPTRQLPHLADYENHSGEWWRKAC